MADFNAHEYNGERVSEDTHSLYYRGQKIKEAWYRGEKVWGGEDGWWSFNPSTGTLSVYCVGGIPVYEHAADFPWYSLRSQITNIVIKNTVTSISNRAFYGCTNSIRVTNPNSVTSIGDYAFYNCRSLRETTIPDSVSINYSAFGNCTSLTSLSFGNGNISISDLAFYNCTNLETISFGTGSTVIGNMAFYNCNGVEELSVPRNVSFASSNAFYNMAGLKHLFIDTPSICDYCFAYSNESNSSLESVTMGPHVTSIGKKAFLQCTSLTTAHVNGNVSDNAFTDCSSLVDLSFGSNTFIGTSAQWNAITKKTGNNDLINAVNKYYESTGP